MSLYTVRYADGTTFEGGTIQDSKWNEINKPIAELIYHFASHHIRLTGFKEYNHVLEIPCLILSGQRFLSKIMLMGYDGEKVIIFTINLVTKKTYKTIRLKGREYNKKPTSGWKVGYSLKPCYRISS